MWRKMKQPCAVWCRDAWNDATEEESSSYKHMPKVCPPEVGSGKDLHMSGTQLNFNGYPSCTVGWCDRDQRIFISFACRHCQLLRHLATHHWPFPAFRDFENFPKYIFFSFLFFLVTNIHSHIHLLLKPVLLYRILGQ